MTWLVAIGQSGMKAQAKDELARVRDARAAAKKARREAKVEASLLEVERTSLLLDILGRLRTKCLLSNLRRARTKSSWRKTIRRPWS